RIVVRKGDDLAGCGIEARIAAARSTLPRCEVDDRQFVLEPRQDRAHAIVAVLVDDDDLGTLVLADQGEEESFEFDRPVDRRNDQREARHAPGFQGAGRLPTLTLRRVAGACEWSMEVSD